MKTNQTVVLVTGGASGLGAGVAQKLLTDSAKVAILDLNLDGAQKFLSQFPENCIAIACDVSQEQQVKSAIDQILQKWNGLNVAVSCAGIAFAIKTLGKNGPHDLETFSKTLQVNLIGTFNVARLSANAMQQNQPNDLGERGVIINTASVAALEGQMGQVAYSASKGGVVAMTLPMARDLASFGIRVNTIAPGLFDTPLLSKLPEPARNSLAQQIPFPSRFGDPLEYAALVQHIIENPMINGETIRIDGAIRMGMK